MYTIYLDEVLTRYSSLETGQVQQIQQLFTQVSSGQGKFSFGPLHQVE